MAAGAGAVHTPGGRGVAGHSAVGPGCPGGARWQEARQGRVAPCRLLGHAPTDGTRPGAALARRPRRDQAARRGLRPLSLPAPPGGAVGPCPGHSGWAWIADVEAGDVCVCGELRRGCGPLSWTAVRADCRPLSREPNWPPCAPRAGTQTAGGRGCGDGWCRGGDERAKRRGRHIVRPSRHNDGLDTVGRGPEGAANSTARWLWSRPGWVGMRVGSPTR